MKNLIPEKLPNERELKEILSQFPKSKKIKDVAEKPLKEKVEDIEGVKFPIVNEAKRKMEQNKRKDIKLAREKRAEERKKLLEKRIARNKKKQK